MATLLFPLNAFLLIKACELLKSAVSDEAATSCVSVYFPTLLCIFKVDAGGTGGLYVSFFGGWGSDGVSKTAGKPCCVRFLYVCILFILLILFIVVGTVTVCAAFKDTGNTQEILY